MRGTCTECGLAIHWAEIFLPEKFEPPWCVEYVKPLRRFGWAWVQTVARSGRPFLFWSTLKMSMPAHPKRLVAYMVMLLLPILIAWVTIQTVVAVQMRNMVQQQMQSWQTQYWSKTTPTFSINQSYGAAVAEAVFLPWRSTSWGTITWTGRTTGYVAPRDLHAQLSRQMFGRNSAWRDDHIVLTLSCFAVGMWIALTMPLAFVLLPISRRRAKVRRGHVARVACYGMVIPAMIGTCMLGCVAVGYAHSDAQEASTWFAHVLGRYGIVPAIVVWWVAAIRCYLHIPHGWAVAPILGILVVVALAGVLLISGLASTFVLVGA